jgi:hypothetical protein
MYSVIFVLAFFALPYVNNAISVILVFFTITHGLTSSASGMTAPPEMIRSLRR